MFAVIKTGGKQYKVAPNDIIKIEKLLGDSGDSIEFTDVLMVGQGETIKVGAPLITGTTVLGTIIEQMRDDKIIVFKKKKRHNYRRKKGHRQSLTVVQITDIFSGERPSKTKAAPEKAAASKPAAEKVAPQKAAPKASAQKEAVKAKPVAKKAESKTKETAPKKAPPKAKKAPKKSGE